MATVDQLKRLGAVLPPNFRVESGALGDVLGAAIALGEYGPDLVAASERGVQEVHNFFHEQAVKVAKDRGEPEPTQSPTEVAPTDPTRAAPPSAGVSRADFDAFRHELLNLLRGEGKDATAPTHSPTAPPSVPTVGESPEPAHPATGEADSGDAPATEDATVPGPDAAPGPETFGPFTPPS